MVVLGPAPPLARAELKYACRRDTKKEQRGLQVLIRRGKRGKSYRQMGTHLGSRAARGLMRPRQAVREEPGWRGAGSTNVRAPATDEPRLPARPSAWHMTGSHAFEAVICQPGARPLLGCLRNLLSR